MKLATTLAILAIASQMVSAHYIFTVLLTGSPTSPNMFSSPVRWVQDYYPVEGDVTSPTLTCNKTPRGPANTTLTVAAGDSIGFRIERIDDRTHYYTKLFHPGPASFYMGSVPEGETAATWDGSGQNWFKIDEISSTKDFHIDEAWPVWGKEELWTTIPPHTPSGQYLFRLEHIAIHLASEPIYGPQFFMVCAQIKVVNGGNGTPGPLVAIPGYVSLENDPGLTVDIYKGNLTSYKIPGPAVWRG